MAAPLGQHFSTICKISFLQSFKVFRICGSRSIKSIKNDKQDLKPIHNQKNDLKRLEETAGPWKTYTDLHYWRAQPRTKSTFDPKKITSILEEMNLKIEAQNDIPSTNLPDPYIESPKRCILCQYNIKLDYKNSQLLSQFVSPYTGRLYGRQITGLCLHMQRRVAREVRTARRLGFMPFVNKSPKYLQDPPLFNPFMKKSYPPGQ